MKSSSSKKHEKGQGLVEYALILVLVAIVVIGGMTVLGPSIGNVFSDINNSITGGSMVVGSDNSATVIPTATIMPTATKTLPPAPQGKKTSTPKP